MKIVKAELDDEVHVRFKVWCVQQGWGMGEAIERLILERTGGFKYPVNTPAVAIPEPEVVTPMAKCRKCGEPFPVADMVTEPKTGKLFCHDCVENMKNNQ